MAQKRGNPVQILLTNDDGIYAPGLAAMERELRKIGDVCVVAPATEQSGVGHSITFLSPLIAREVFEADRHRGWAVEGSPADCVKIGVFEFCPRKPDLVVSGINGGLNVRDQRALFGHGCSGDRRRFFWNHQHRRFAGT